MIKIDILKNHPECIPRLADIWQELLGKAWYPDVSIQEIQAWYTEWLNDTLPLAFIALDGQLPVGACSLQSNDGIRPDLTPWMGDLVIDPSYQNQGIGSQLINAVKNKARDLGFDTLYLCTFSDTLPDYYGRLGWIKIGMDQCHGSPVTVMSINIEKDK